MATYIAHLTEERVRPSGASERRARAAQVASGGTMRGVGAEHGLARGESGTVGHVFGTADAYLVEFVDPADGSTRALAELMPDQRAPAGA
jgi:hypothetical protein